LEASRRSNASSVCGTPSAASAGSIVEAFGLPREHIRVIHDGVETDVFQRLDDVQVEPNRVLFVGNSEDRNKGIVYLLRALRLLRGHVPFHLRVVHHPGSKGAPRLVQQLGLHGRVTFLEDLSTAELVHQYNRAQLLVSPSLYEGFGLPAAEAMACEAPVVATTGGAFPEVIDHDRTGWLVPPGDSVALAGAIRLMMEDADLRARLGRAGRQSILERFSWRKAAEETQAMYEEMLGLAPAAPAPVAARSKA